MLCLRQENKEEEEEDPEQTESVSIAGGRWEVLGESVDVQDVDETPAQHSAR